MQVNSILTLMREQFGHLHSLIEPFDYKSEGKADDSLTAVVHSFIVNYNQYLMCNIKTNSLLGCLLLIIPLLLLVVVLLILLEDVAHLFINAGGVPV